jgi:transcriptional regulator with XRE-family HTH domain
MRELREYFASSYESHHKIAARIGVAVKTFADWLSGDRQPTAKALAKLQTFLDAEVKRNAGDGIRPIERVPFKNHPASQKVALRSALSILPKGAG